MNWEKIHDLTKQQMGGDEDGHGWAHILQVVRLAGQISEQEPEANRDVVRLAALLHDCDDYKLAGKEAAAALTNTRRILAEGAVDPETAEKVCDIVGHMGYSRALKGIRPQTLEGKIVSDADMLEAMGASAVVRALSYSLSAGKPVFVPEWLPQENLGAEEYTDKNRQNSFINHFFDKLLKLKDMMFTKAAKEEAQIRHQTMLQFLEAFFREQNQPQWTALLNKYK